MIIDAKELILGRMAAKVAKKALEGETIDIINAEQAVITGSKSDILAEYKHRQQRGQPKTGPFFFTKENLFVKRAIRGMLPYKKEKGRVAFKRIKCYVGIPSEFKDIKAETVEGAHISKVQMLKYISVKELCYLLGRREQA